LVTRLPTSIYLNTTIPKIVIDIIRKVVISCIVRPDREEGEQRLGNRLYKLGVIAQNSTHSPTLRLPRKLHILRVNFGDWSAVYAPTSGYRNSPPPPPLNFALTRNSLERGHAPTSRSQRFDTPLPTVITLLNPSETGDEASWIVPSKVSATGEKPRPIKTIGSHSLAQQMLDF
jgi:hypothetical protein